MVFTRAVLASFCGRFCAVVSAYFVRLSFAAEFAFIRASSARHLNRERAADHRGVGKRAATRV